MKRYSCILFLAISLCARCLTPTLGAGPKMVDDTCSIIQTDYQSLVGILGEEVLTPGGWSVEACNTSYFSSGNMRISFGKNRSRTSFLRRTIQNHQPSFIVFRGVERGETCPFSTCVGSRYYVYTLRRILC